MSTAAAPATRRGSQLSRAALVSTLIIAAVLGARELTNEAAVSLHGDMPRYMMDGVFVWDFITDGGVWTPDAAVRYAQQYFAQYPALSLGHHPPLVFLVQVPFFAIFGVSVFAARLSMIACTLVSAAALFGFSRRRYGWPAATWITLFVFTNPVMVGFSQRVMSEIPMIMCVLLALVALDRFCDTQRSRYYYWFMAAVVASLYAKQLAIFVAPVYLLVLVSRLGVKRLLRLDVVLSTIAGALVVVPLVAMTYVLSPFNVAVAVNVTSRMVASRGSLYLRAVASHLTWPALMAVAAGIVLSIVQRDRRMILNLVWIASVVAGAVAITGRAEPERYAVLAIPAYGLCVASLASTTMTHRLRQIGATALALAIGAQIWIGRDVKPAGAGGYEEMARFTLTASRSPVVMYSATIDTGYFVFFTRKHDPDGRLIVLRADKILTTSMMSRVAIENRVTTPEEIYEVLKRFGVQYVVLEDRPNNSKVLQMLRSELTTGRFVERLRLPIQTTDRRLRGVELVAYEFLDAQPPDETADVDMRLPIIGRDLTVRLGDLIRPSER